MIIGALITLILTILAILVLLGAAWAATHFTIFGLPPAQNWSDLAGAFTGAAALFTGLALIGVVFTLRHQARDSQQQAERLRESIDQQNLAIGHLGEAATALKEQVAAISCQAQHAADLARTAEADLKLRHDEYRIIRLQTLMDRFLAADRPDVAAIEGLTMADERQQTAFRQMLPPAFVSSLGLLLTSLLRMQSNETGSDVVKIAVQDLLEELRTRLSTQEKTTLALAELCPVQNCPPDYQPSRLAQTLHDARLLPFIEQDSPRHPAWQLARRAGGQGQR